jgi:WXXGXW repeat (2 copies)
LVNFLESHGAYARARAFSTVEQRSGSSRIAQRPENPMQLTDRRGGLAAIVLTAAALYGCYTPPPAQPVAEIAAAQATPSYTPPYPSPQYGSTWPPATTAPSNAGVTESIIAPYAPPPPRVETPPPSPDLARAWQPGHWSWTGQQYVWTPGRYVVPPSAISQWVPGYWQQGPNGWYWVEGRWV